MNENGKGRKNGNPKANSKTWKKGTKNEVKNSKKRFSHGKKFNTKKQHNKFKKNPRNGKKKKFRKKHVHDHSKKKIKKEKKKTKEELDYSALTEEVLRIHIESTVKEKFGSFEDEMLMQKDDLKIEGKGIKEFRPFSIISQVHYGVFSKNLRVLNFSNNKITNLLFLQNLENLENLNLNNNNLVTLMIPKQLRNSTFNFPKLKKINISNNPLSSLKGIGIFRNLEYLFAVSNKLTSSVNSLSPDFFSLSKLKNLKLNENQITTIPKEFSELKNLIEIDFSNNQIADMNELLVFSKGSQKTKEIKEENIRDGKTTEILNSLKRIKIIGNPFIQKNKKNIIQYFINKNFKTVIKMPSFKKPKKVVLNSDIIKENTQGIVVKKENGEIKKEKNDPMFDDLPDLIKKNPKKRKREDRDNRDEKKDKKVQPPKKRQKKDVEIVIEKSEFSKQPDYFGKMKGKENSQFVNLKTVKNKFGNVRKNEKYSGVVNGKNTTVKHLAKKEEKEDKNLLDNILFKSEESMGW